MNKNESKKLKEQAEKGDVEALYKLGLHYLNHPTLFAGRKKGFAYAKAAADQGHAGAQYLVGVSYWSGLGAKVNKKEGEKSWRLSAAQGYASAIDNLKRNKLDV